MIVQWSKEEGKGKGSKRLFRDMGVQKRKGESEG